MPMLLIQKPRKAPGDPIRLRTVIDLRERNANTQKLSSPLPDIEEVLNRVAAHKYRSIFDGSDAYEQIRVEPEDVPKTVFNTPEGTMMSLVMQQGDCNAGATYQMLQPYIGVFLDVYLDDIIIYSNSLEEHVKHIKIVLDLLKKEKFYLSEKKMQLFARELHILGHIVDDEGIRMDPYKVDAIEKWKIPTNVSALQAFLGAVGY